MDWARHGYRWLIGKSVSGIQTMTQANGRPSSEVCDTSSQEKLLVLMHERPVPKPTQVDEASSLS